MEPRHLNIQITAPNEQTLDKWTADLTMKNTDNNPEKYALFMKRNHIFTSNKNFIFFSGSVGGLNNSDLSLTYNKHTGSYDGYIKFDDSNIFQI
ncbi:hypothetical protein ROZALSC1DRAFT_31412, partial [Rozella allomycis CSF55]